MPENHAGPFTELLRDWKAGDENWATARVWLHRQLQRMA